jgi:hypothetical protein
VLLIFCFVYGGFGDEGSGTGDFVMCVLHVFLFVGVIGGLCKVFV